MILIKVFSKAWLSSRTSTHIPAAGTESKTFHHESQTFFGLAAVNPETTPESCPGLNARPFLLLPQGGARPQLLNANRVAFISGTELRFNF